MAHSQPIQFMLSFAFFFFYWVGGGGERGEGRQGEGLGDNRDWNILPHFIQVINETRNLRVFF